MAYQPIEKLLPRSNSNIYKLILLAGRRATELADGRPRLIETPSTPKATTIALDEIMEGKVWVKGCEPEEVKKEKAGENKEGQEKEAGVAEK